MKRSYRSVAVVVLAVVSIAKGEPAASQPARRKIDPELKAIMLEYQKAQGEWGEEERRITETQGHYAKLPPLPSEIFVPRLKEYIARNAGTQNALDAFVVILTGANRIQSIDCGKPADQGSEWSLRTLTHDYATLPAVKGLLNYAEPGIVLVPRESRLAFARAVIETNPDREAVAEGKCVLASNLMTPDIHEKPPFEPSASDRENGAALLRELAKSYSDTVAGQQAARELFELDHLQEGMIAPDFSATAVDGEEISMAGLRGRVVVLVFWGGGWANMEGHRIPVSADVIARFGGKPVAFVGISDYSAEKIRETIAKERVQFPNIAEGRERKIAKLWNVRGSAAVRVIDAQGVIRCRTIGWEKLEGAVNELLEQSATGAGEAKP